VVQWCSGAVVQWCSGAVVQWCSGAVVQRCSGAVVQWYSGAVWHDGAVRSKKRRKNALRLKFWLSPSSSTPCVFLSFCYFVILSFCLLCWAAPFFSLRPLARPLSVEFTGR
jgi:hypothetical protein